MFGYNYGMNEDEVKSYGKDGGDGGAKDYGNDGYYGNFYNYQPYSYDMNGCYESPHKEMENGSNMESGGMISSVESMGGGSSANHGASESGGMGMSSNMSHISNVNGMKRKMNEGMGMGTMNNSRGIHMIDHESNANTAAMSSVSPGNSGMVMGSNDMNMRPDTKIRLGNNIRIDSSHRQDSTNYGALRRHDDSLPSMNSVNGMSSTAGYTNAPMNTGNGMGMPKMGGNNGIGMGGGYNPMEYSGNYSNVGYNPGLGVVPGNDSFGYNLNHGAMNGSMVGGNPNHAGMPPSHSGAGMGHSGVNPNLSGANSNGSNFPNYTPNMNNTGYNNAYYNYPYQNCPATPSNGAACTPYSKAPSTPGTGTNNIFMNDIFMNQENAYINPWMNKKKRKNNPLLWQYIKQHQDFYPGIMHPSKYSSLDFIQGMNKTQKMYLGSIKRMPIIEKNNSNSILPLYLNSASILENSMHHTEFMRVSKSFFARIKNLDYENVTVQQLKNIMKEFGLNHTGKKIDLIERVKSTKDLISEKLKEEKVERKGDEKESTMDSLFF